MVTTRARIDGTHLLILVAAALLFLTFGYTEMAGSDMWWHIAAGRELVQTGNLWMVDDWSYTAAGDEWLNHEWLADLAYYAWVNAWGVSSLVYWKWGVIVLTFALLLLVLARTSGSPLAALLCSGFALAAAAPFLDVRPHLYSLLGFALLLLLRLQRPASSWLLALIFVVWVNLHGGFFFGLMALAVLVFPWRAPGVAAIRSAAGIGLLCLLACVLNPSGIKVFLYPLTYAFETSSPYRGISEWLSPFEPGGIRSPLFFYLMWLPLLGFAYLAPPVRRTVGVPWEGIVLTALTLAMALTSRRFIPLFGMSLAVMLAPLVGLCLHKLRADKFGFGLAAAALLYALLRLAPYPTQATPAFHYLVAEYSYPVDMLDFVEVNGISGNVFSLWNWGGYIHWRTDGGLRVFIDGRANTVYDDDTYRRYIMVLGSSPGWLKLVEDSGADYVLWPHARGKGQQKLRELLATGRWQPLYSDAVSWLAVRRAVAPAGEPALPTPGPWRDLALASNSARVGNSEAALQYATRVREVMPWHKSACDLVVSTLRNQGKPADASAVLEDCRGYFPTAYLR